MAVSESRPTIHHSRFRVVPWVLSLGSESFRPSRPRIAVLRSSRAAITIHARCAN